MTKTSTDALLAHRAQVAVRKRQSVIDAIDLAADRPGTVTVTGIARAAGVSREFIHSHPDLRDRVRRLAQQKEDGQRRIESGQADLRDGRAVDRSTLINQVIRQREKIGRLEDRVAQLEAARARHLGEQLIALEESPAIASVESIATSERLATENERLQRDLDEALRLVVRLRNELAGARQALAEALASDGETPSFVVLDGDKDPRSESTSR